MHSDRMPPPVRKSVCGTGWAAGSIEVPPALPYYKAQIFLTVSAMCSMFRIPTTGRIGKFPFGR